MSEVEAVGPAGMRWLAEVGISHRELGDACQELKCEKREEDLYMQDKCKVTLLTDLMRQ